MSETASGGAGADASKRPRKSASSGAGTTSAAPVRVPVAVVAGQDVTDLAMALTGGAVVRSGHGLWASTPSSAPSAAPAASSAGSDALDSDSEPTRLIVSRAGVLRFRAPDRLWVETSTKRYVPAIRDTVVGVVLERRMETYRIEIGGTCAASLPHLAFDGASRRNKPDLPIGTLVYARVVATDRHSDVELTCQVSDGPKRDWVTGESQYGELRGGSCVRVGVAHSKS
jgi:exosome complex component RRP40